MQHRLDSVLKQHGLLCGAVISEQGVVLARAGDFGQLASDGLASTLLGPKGSPLATYGLVQPDEKIRPAMMEEGFEFALLDRAGSLMVVVFGRERVGIVEHMQLAQRVGQTIAHEFAA